MKWWMALAALAMASVWAIGVHAADLQPAKNEPNLEKRSRLALTNADTAISEAREAYNAQDMKTTVARLAEVRESVELAQAALAATGKKPGRSPGPYKFAETKSRELLRRLEGLKQEMDAADREMIEPVQNRVQEIHDAWLDGILTHAK
ncbi:MAG TPA: hypothetical protein VGL72_25240 [Bryobacteraceae bacterium]|jgi:hypothetical protein